MSGGGKGPAPVAPTYTDPVNGQTFTDATGGADALNAEIQQRVNKATMDTDNAAGVKKMADQDAETAFQTRFGDAKKNATSNINDYFSNQGVDPTGYAAQIAQSVNSSGLNVADLDTAPGSKFAPSMGSDLFNQIQGGKQSQALSSYNKEFDPSYSLTHLPSSMNAGAIATAVNSQFDPLMQQLTNAQKRGTLTGTGYQGALNQFNTDKTKATATVTGLADNVVKGDQGDLNTYLDTGRTLAGHVPLGTDFSNDPYRAGAADIISKDTGKLSGDVQNAVGATKFSDLTTLLNAGGAAQGSADPTAGNPNGLPGGGSLSPEALASQVLAKQPRGLGTQGQF